MFDELVGGEQVGVERSRGFAFGAEVDLPRKDQCSEVG